MAQYKTEIFGQIGAQARLHPVYAALVPIIAIIVMMLATTIGMLPLLLTGFYEALSGTNEGLLYQLVFGFGAVTVATLAWVKWVEKRSLASMGWRFERALFRYGRGFAIGLAMNFAAIGIIGILGGYQIGNWAPALLDVAALGTIALFLVGFIIQGGTEEVLTRGWMLSTMASRWGLPIAIGVTSSLFALLHLPNEWPHVNWIAMANIVLIGVFFALFTVKERSLLGVCAIHSSWNWIMGVGFGLNVSGHAIDAEPLVVGLRQKPEIAEWITGGSFGPEGSVFVTLVIVVSCVLVWGWRGEDLITSDAQTSAVA